MNEIIKQLPRTIQLRFDGLGRYIRAFVAMDEETQPQAGRKKAPLSTEQITLVQFIALVWSLDRFLRDGTKAAQSAAGLFKELDALGFSVGNAVFTTDNDNTMRGERLATELRASLSGTRFHGIVESSASLQSLVKKLIREIKREQPAVG